MWEGQDRSQKTPWFLSALLPVCTAKPVSRAQGEVGLVDWLDTGGEVGHGVASHLHGASATPVSEKHKRTTQGQPQRGCVLHLGNLFSESRKGSMEWVGVGFRGQKSQQNTRDGATDMFYVCQMCDTCKKKQAKFHHTVVTAALTYFPPKLIRYLLYFKCK